MSLGYVQHFRDLEVYKRICEVSGAVFELTKGFPSEERFSLTDQIRRSSRSVGAQIAEAWAKRFYPKHFISKLTDADGEQLETQHWLSESRICHYITEATRVETTGKFEVVGRMLGSMIRKANSFTDKDSMMREDDKPLPYLPERIEIKY